MNSYERTEARKVETRFLAGGAKLLKVRLLSEMDPEELRNLPRTDPLQCDYCPIVFKRDYTRRQHMRLHFSNGQ